MLFIFYFFHIILICVFSSNVVSESIGVQDPIPDFEKALDMAAILLSGNLEQEIVKVQNRKTGSLPVTFENIYAELDQGEINFRILLKPTLFDLPKVQLKQVFVKLKSNRITVSAEWQNVSVHASYESHYEHNSTPILRINGELSFRWDSIKAEGFIGLKTLDDVIQTANYDLSYSFGPLSLDIVDHNSKDVTVHAVIDACKDIAPKLYWDLTWELRSTLKAEVDELLRTEGKKYLFSSRRAFNEYKALTRSLTANVNSFIDSYLDIFRKSVLETYLTRIPLKNIEKRVDANIGIVNLQGDLLTMNGSAGDMSTLRRHGDFSIWLTDSSGQIEISGPVEFAELSAKYEHYEAKSGSIRVVGNFTSEASSNLMYLKMFIVPDSKSRNGYRVIVNDFKVIRLGRLSVKVTGVGALNNFVSLMATMVLNHFKADLVAEMDKNLFGLMDKVVNPH